MAPILELSRAITTAKLQTLLNINLRPLADEHNIVLLRQKGPHGDFNYDWPQHTLERVLSLPDNYLHDGHFIDEAGPWTLRVIQIQRKDDLWLPITGFQLREISTMEPLPPFGESQFRTDISRMLLVGFTFSLGETQAHITHLQSFDLADPRNATLLEEIIADYEQTRVVLRLPNGYSRLTSYMGKWISSAPHLQ